MSLTSIGEYLIKFLLADAGVSALVDTRIFPWRLPQKVTLPAIVVQMISDPRIEQLHGKASASAPRYQVDAWAANVKDAHAVSNAIRMALEQYVGEWTDGGNVRTRVAVEYVTSRESFEEDILGGLCRKSTDYFVFHSTIGATI